ncbi:multiple epidermal growth factor-like domains protein 6 [Saccostrea cucullata]|uniref:multiple epidermal growth factor-like domains protein 6 n=1 Tax=Saccostrea cuccullata TaxID=36930 RepID=UPI002ED06228
MFFSDSSNGYTSRFLGFYVYISNTTDRFDGHLCFHDTIYNRSTIPAVVNISCPVHGQYVIYYNERLLNVTYPTGYSQYAFTDFCEVEVYGCATPMRYGSNCSLLCPVNCKQYCNIQLGNCFQCSPGYKGEQCEQKCDGNLYGRNCRETCGSCLYLRQCHHVNGSCKDGCNPGYQGEKCDKVCSFGYFGSDCKEECSAFCKTTRDCHYETGSCTQGCKSGWQGHDCFQIQAKEENDWPSRFYGLLAAFCVCEAVIIVMLVVVFLQRRRMIVRKAQKTLKESKNPQCNTGYVDVMSTEKIKSEYQELSDIKEPSTYDVIK